MSTITASISTNRTRVIAIIIAATALIIGLTAAAVTTDFSVAKSNYKSNFTTVAKSNF